MSNTNPLTHKKKIFIREYCVNGFNATQAALTAGYSAKTARSQGQRLLTKVDIRGAIKEYLDDVIEKYKDTLEYEIVKVYKILAFYDPSDIIDVKGALIVKDLEDLGELSIVIKGIEKTYKDGYEVIKVKLADREDALKQLAAYMKLMLDNNIVVNNYNTTLDTLDKICNNLKK
jgi:phage terminase small subunit